MIKAAVVGFGNLGRAALLALQKSEDFEAVCVFSRRETEIAACCGETTVRSFSSLETFGEKIDVVLNCMGSADDLPATTPFIAGRFNVVDSFDVHARIPEHIQKVESAARRGGKTAVVGVGWDPGLFSLSRLYMKSVMADAEIYTFWGRGVSQGHSEAIRSIDGVLLAREYTVPVAAAVERIKEGRAENLSPKQLHRRICYVVAKDGADTALIEEKIKNMPEYFKGYETTVNFITADDFLLEHKSMAHSGNVLSVKKSDDGLSSLSFSLSTASNPKLTADIMLAYAKACVKLNKKGEAGCKTVFDIKPSDLFSDEEKKYSLL